MQVRIDEKKVVTVKSIVISEEEAEQLLAELQKVMRGKERNSHGPSKVPFGDLDIIISNL